MAHHAQRHSEDVVETVIALAKQGMARSEIARQVGMTRNAVLGLLHRRGIKAAPINIKTKRSKRNRACHVNSSKAKQVKDREAAIAAAAVKAAALNAQAKAVSISSGVTWDDLNSSHQCRWPIADGLWCGQAKATRSYCVHHYALSRRAA